MLRNGTSDELLELRYQWTMNYLPWLKYLLFYLEKQTQMEWRQTLPQIFYNEKDIQVKSLLEMRFSKYSCIY